MMTIGRNTAFRAHVDDNETEQAILILNALETEAPRDAEKAIKAIRSKAVLRGTDWDRIKRDAIQNRNMEHYRSDFERLGKL